MTKESTDQNRTKHGTTPWYQKKRWKWFVWFCISLVILLIAILITHIAFLNYHGPSPVERTTDFFAQFWGAMIAALIAAYFVVYQSKRERKDTQDSLKVQQEQAEKQRKQEHGEWLAEKYEEARPTIVLSHSNVLLEKGDKVFIAKSLLQDLPVKTYIQTLLRPWSPDQSPEYLEIRTFYGEPVYNIRLSYTVPSYTESGDTKTSQNGTKRYFDIPYIQPNQRNVIITADTANFYLKSNRQRAEMAHIFKKNGLSLEFDTAMNEHVKLNYMYQINAKEAEISEHNMNIPNLDDSSDSYDSINQTKTGPLTQKAKKQEPETNEFDEDIPDFTGVMEEYDALEAQKKEDNEPFNFELKKQYVMELAYEDSSTVETLKQIWKDQITVKNRKINQLPQLHDTANLFTADTVSYTLKEDTESIKNLRKDQSFAYMQKIYAEALLGVISFTEKGKEYDANDRFRVEKLLDSLHKAKTKNPKLPNYEIHGLRLDQIKDALNHHISPK